MLVLTCDKKKMMQIKSWTIGFPYHNKITAMNTWSGHPNTCMYWSSQYLFPFRIKLNNKILAYLNDNLCYRLS